MYNSEATDVMEHGMAAAAITTDLRYPTVLANILAQLTAIYELPNRSTLDKFPCTVKTETKAKSDIDRKYIAYTDSLYICSVSLAILLTLMCNKIYSVARFLCEVGFLL